MGLEFLRDEVERLQQAGVYRPLRVLEGPQAPRCTIDGRPVVNLASNNYLGLCNEPRLVAAATAAAERWGAGTGAVRTIIGTQSIHLELEEHLARFKHTEASVVFQSGFACNLGVIPVLVGEGDAILSDELNHASIIDGCRLTKAAVLRYRHCDMNHLEERLREARQRGSRRVLVISDGVFSMDGDIAPLPDIVALAERHGAVTCVDDAHASGVLGTAGRGSPNHFGLDGRVDVQVGTLSKAVGVLGGYVASTRHLVELLWHLGRPFLFSTSHPPAVTGACLAALELMESEPWRMERLWDNTRYYQAALGRLGFDTGRSATPITPILVGDEQKAMDFSDRLFAAGVFAQGIAFPTVPRGQARIRTIVTAAHTRDDLDAALQGLEQVGRQLGLI